jgi:hypothetical protein
MELRCTVLVLGSAVVLASCGESPSSPSGVPSRVPVTAQAGRASVTWTCVAMSQAGVFSFGIACPPRGLLAVETPSADLVAPGTPTNFVSSVRKRRAAS